MRTRRHSKGYVLVLVPGHPMAWADGWAYEHRVVFNDQVRELIPGEVVHHVDEDKANNDHKNLRAGPHDQHSRTHMTSEWARIIGRRGGKATARLRRRRQT